MLYQRACFGPWIKIVYQLNLIRNNLIGKVYLYETINNGILHDESMVSVLMNKGGSKQLMMFVFFEDKRWNVQVFARCRFKRRFQFCFICCKEDGSLVLYKVSSILQANFPH